MKTPPKTNLAPFYIVRMARRIGFIFLLLASPEFVISQPLLLNQRGGESDISEEDKNFERVINDLLTRRNSGDMAAPAYLGENYLHWNRSPEDVEAGIFYLEEAANYGFADAQMKLGRLYLEGKLVAKDNNKARLLFTAAAQQGKAEALRVLAGMYVFGNGVKKDREIAASYLKRAAELGDRYSTYQYARSLIWGPEEKNKKELGVLILTELAEKEHSESEFLLAKLYLAGEHVSYDPSLATHWLSRAAENGHVIAKILDLQLQYEKTDFGNKKALIREQQNELSDRLDNDGKNQIAWMMSTHSYDPFRDGEFSVRVMEEMLEREGGLPPPYLDTLAAAYAAAGKFENAIKMQSQVIEVIEGKDSKPAAKEFFERLALYKDKKQYIQ